MICLTECPRAVKMNLITISQDCFSEILRDNWNNVNSQIIMQNARNDLGTCQTCIISVFGDFADVYGVMLHKRFLINESTEFLVVD